METELYQSPRYHLMIVGIDDYKGGINPLGGCVNDAVAIAKMLIENEVPQNEVEKGLFLAPIAGKTVPWSFRAPTRENLLQRLDEIASRAERNDHVWIYYSGHGTQREHGQTAPSAIFEALVPSDFGAPSTDLLYDFEFGRRLARMKPESVTVILDCCNSAGATKNLPGLQAEGTAVADGADRYIELSLQQLAALPPPQATFDDIRGFGGKVEQTGNLPTVVAACHADEKAREDSATGKRHGILTATFLEAIASCQKDKMPIQKLRWADIWPDLRQRVQQRNSAQQPWLSGPLARPCLGGPAGAYDAGFAINAQPTLFAIGAGKLLDLRPGSLLGVYSTEPPLFAALNSESDVAGRIMTLRVVQAELLTAIAQPVEGAMRPLPRGARARLINVSLTVFLSPGVAQRLDGSLMISQAKNRHLNLQLTSTPDEAELQVVRLPNGTYALGDSENPPEESSSGTRPLAVLVDDEEREDKLREALIEAMLHYAQYVQPLRMVRLAQSLGGDRRALAVSVLDVDLVSCGGLSEEQCDELNENRRPRVAMVPKSPGRYKLRVSPLTDGGSPPSPDVYALWFRSKLPLFVSVLCCNGEGQIEEYLLDEQVPEGSVGKLVWRNGKPGEGFDMRIIPPRGTGVERLIVIASTIKGGHGLESLKQERTLQGAIDREKNRSIEESADRPLAGVSSTSKLPTSWTARTLTMELEL